MNYIINKIILINCLILIKVLRFIDKFFIGFLNILISPLKKIFIKEELKTNPKKILVIRLWALGSSILTFPMIKQLQNHYGENIDYDVLVTNRTKSIFENQGYFKNYIDFFSLKELIKLLFSFKKYDIVIDTEEYFNSSSLISLWLGKINIGYNNLFTRKIVYNNSVTYNDKDHACLAYLDLLKPLGITVNKPKYLEAFLYNKNDKNKVDIFLENYSGKKILCFHTGGAETSSDRFWSNNNWLKLIDKIDNENTFIFLSGTKFEEKTVLEILEKTKNKNVVNICNKFNLRQFAYFLEKSDLMISNDTGPMHLSACMKTKTIGLFGPNLPRRFGAYPLEKNINLYKGNNIATIDVHLGVFKEDKNLFVNKISADEVHELVFKEINK